MFRNESSGEMHGIIRVRQFTISEGHIICKPDQVQQIFDECLDLVNFMMRAVGLSDMITFRFSKWDPKNKEKYIGSPQVWEKAQAEIKKALIRNKLKFEEVEGDAAFYGPKIDVQIRNVYGKEDSLVTIQLDMALAEKYDMQYIDETGYRSRPYIIHRTSIGCYDRLLALLIERYMGAFPVWLSPTQVTVMGISNKQDEYIKRVADELQSNNIRVKTDTRNEKLGYKIREATMKKIPFAIIVGEKEEQENKISVRTREGVDLGSMDLQEFVNKVKELCKEFK